MKGRAVITGADGGMGFEITKAVALAGYEVVMLCLDAAAGEKRKEQAVRETGCTEISVREVDLSRMKSVEAVAASLLQENVPIALLMNNAGTMCTHFEQTEDGLERTVAVNYVAPYLLTRRLLPLMGKGSRVVCMVSCTYAIGRITPEFFTRGRRGSFWRIPIYSHTKLALWLFVRELASRVRERGILVNAFSVPLSGHRNRVRPRPCISLSTICPTERPDRCSPPPASAIWLPNIWRIRR